MKFFIDTANVEEIRKAWEVGVIDGVTTNPSLMAREKGNPVDILKEICSVVDGPVSAEAVSLRVEEMVKEGEELAKIHENIVVKIPMTLWEGSMTSAMWAWISSAISNPFSRTTSSIRK